MESTSASVRERLTNALMMMQTRERVESMYVRDPIDFAFTRFLLADAEIALEGVPCVGKTSLAREMAAALRAQGSIVEVDYEDRDDAVLNQFFKDPATFGFFFQLFKLKSRHARLEARRYARLRASVLAAGAQHVHYILDRTLPGDMAFAFWNYVMGNFTVEQLRTYMQYATEMKTKFPMPALTLYASAAPDALAARVQSRGNPDEMALYTPAYFKVLDACYRLALDWCGCHYVAVDHSAHYPDGKIPADACLALLERALVQLHDKNLRRVVAIEQTFLEEQLDRLRSRAVPEKFIASV